MELDDNDLVHPIVPGVSATTASLTLGQEIGAPIVPSATGDPGKDAMGIDDVSAASCVGQLAAVLIHEGGLLTSGTAKKKSRSGFAKNSAGYVGGSHQTSRHQSHLTYLSKQ